MFHEFKVLMLNLMKFESSVPAREEVVDFACESLLRCKINKRTKLPHRCAKNMKHNRSDRRGVHGQIGKSSFISEAIFRMRRGFERARRELSVDCIIFSSFLSTLILPPCLVFFLARSVWFFSQHFSFRPRTILLIFIFMSPHRHEAYASNLRLYASAYCLCLSPEFMFGFYECGARSRAKTCEKLKRIKIVLPLQR